MRGGEGDEVQAGKYELELSSEADAVAKARQFASSTLAGSSELLLADVGLVVTELVTNAVLHGRPPIRLVVEPRGAGAHVEVFDAGPRPPLRIRDAGQSMTGRGLALVAALSTAWGVKQEDDGKLVWSDIPAEGIGAGTTTSGVDLGDVLRSWTTTHSDDQLFTVELGDVPTDLLLEAKSHVDNLVREFVLVAGSDATGQPEWLSALVESVVRDFASARTQIKEQAVSAAARQASLTHLVLELPATAALAGERYLAALDDADRYARNARLLTLEAPPVHKVFRRWYVESIIDQLLAQVEGEEPPRPPAFAERLAEEFTRLAPLRKTAARLSVIQKVTADLAAAATVKDVAETVVENALELLLADVAVVYLLDDDGMLRAVRRDGAGDDSLASAYEAFPVDADLPGSIALRTRQPLVFRSKEDFETRFPQLKGDHPEDMRLLVAPLAVGDHGLGVIALRFVGTSAVDEDSQLTLLTTLAGVTSQALERAFATSVAAEAVERLALLADASAVLASSLDHREVLQDLAEVIVPRLADWCSVQLAEDDELVTVGFAHVDPELTAWVLGMHGRYPMTADATDVGAPAVLRTGVSELSPRVPEDLIEAAVLDPDHLRVVRSLGMTSALAVPVRGQTGVIGTITMVHATSGRHFDLEDLTLAEDLARRAGAAVETAHAFRDQSTRLEDVLRVAEAAQHAILAVPPAQVGSYALGAHYISAAAEALVGGDLYEITQRPGAVRLLIGDVRGKGLEAIRIATIVLGEFRAAAADLDDLTRVARQIDRRVRSYLGDEDFVTALIADLNDDGTYTLVNCGHPAPLLAAAAGGLSELQSPVSVPLGLGVDPVSVTGVLQPDDRLLLFTDGLIEARETSGGFVDLMKMTAPLVSAPFDTVLDEVVGRVQEATGGPLADDLALLIAEYRPQG
jgi:serine phosphatase RsbU (regulator of sigma subunit)/anti-sigma regulatory factor (Ser/Thr protein kinase)